MRENLMRKDKKRAIESWERINRKREYTREKESGKIWEKRKKDRNKRKRNKRGGERRNEYRRDEKKDGRKEWVNEGRRGEIKLRKDGRMNREWKRGWKEQEKRRGNVRKMYRRNEWRRKEGGKDELRKKPV